VLTDNLLTSLQSKSELKAAVEQRWVSELASFNFNIKYHAGKQNMNVNAVSHLEWEKHEKSAIGQVDAALASSVSTTAVPESL